MKRISASFLSLALALLSPGLGAQSAFAQVVGMNAGVTSAGAQAGSVGAAGVAAVQPMGMGIQGSRSLGQLGMSSLTGAPQLGIAANAAVNAGSLDSVARVSARQAPTALTPAVGLDSTRAPPAAAKQAPKAKGGMFNALREKFTAIGRNNAKADTPVEEHSVEFVVMFDGAAGAITQDMHLDFLEGRGRGRMLQQVVFNGEMNQQMENVGEGQNMYAFNAQPIATYKRINAATVRVKASRADAFKKAMESRQHSVYENEVIKLQPPIEDDPRYEGKNVPNGAVLNMPDTLRLSTADKVHQIATERWGAPSTLRRFGRRVLGLFGRDVPQPKVAVLDTGADATHPLLKKMQPMQNMTPGKAVDDNGHGSWCTSMVMWFAPWLKSVTQYKIFWNDSTTLDVILKALTKAANDGNIVMSNSWGGGYGDPAGPSSKLVRKLAEEGHIMVFAAGNSGYYGANTVGDPAIVHYRTKDGTPRVLAVAATDRTKHVTRFSSKGPGSRTTSRGGEWKDYPNKPDIAEQGENTEAAWPKNLRPDRTDPELGSVRAISGTSMSTPKQAGTIALLASLFGVTEVGKNLDIVVDAVMKTLTNEHKQPATAIGEGFNEVYAAYLEIEKVLKPAVPGATVKRYIESYQAQMKPASAKTPEEIVEDSIRFVNNLRMLGFLALAVLATGVLAWVGAGMLIEWLLGLGALLAL